jgi:hypothetical protein
LWKPFPLISSHKVYIANRQRKLKRKLSRTIKEHICFCNDEKYRQGRSLWKPFPLISSHNVYFANQQQKLKQKLSRSIKKHICYWNNEISSMKTRIAIWVFLITLNALSLSQFMKGKSQMTRPNKKVDENHSHDFQSNYILKKFMDSSF